MIQGIMQRFMSFDPRGTCPAPDTSPLTSMCHKFHASRIQAAEKLKYEINRRKFDTNSEEFMDDRLYNIIDEIAQLASRDVKIADQLGKTSDDADRVRQHFQRYQAWSGGLSPNPEVDETNIGSSFEDLRASPATLPRSADASMILNPRFGAFEATKKIVHVTDFPFTSSSTLSVSARNDDFLKHGDAELGKSRPTNKCSILHSSTDHPSIPDVKSGDGAKAARNQIVNKGRAGNKIQNVEIHISDYDNKLAYKEKPCGEFESIPSRDGIICTDSKTLELQNVTPSVRITKETETELNNRTNKEILKECQEKLTRGKIDSDKFHDSRSNNKSSEHVLTSSTLPRPQKFNAIDFRSNSEHKNLQSIINKGQPPQVPIKKSSLSTIKSKNRG